ncbi:YfjP family GTPase [Streptomyces olivaceus]|uniref:YfjP family GTPase n=1 Tax=Streptomyces olivaceus TaxID=47716 RepID=UPI00371F8D38
MTAVTDQDPTEHTDHTTGEGRTTPGDRALRASRAGRHTSPADEHTSPADEGEQADAPRANSADRADQTDREAPEGREVRQVRERRADREGPAGAGPAGPGAGRADGSARSTGRGPVNDRKPAPAVEREAAAPEDSTGDTAWDTGADAGQGARLRRRDGERLRRRGDRDRDRDRDRVADAADVAATAAADAGHGGASGGDEGAWGDGLIARRVDENGTAEQYAVLPSRPPSSSAALMPLAYDGNLRSRLDALRELVGLSRARLDSGTLAEAGRVLDEAAARRRLSGQHTVVAIAGATGSGKSQLFNTLAGVTISETGVRRPTTAAPIACSWSDGAASLLDRLGIPGRLRRRPLQHPDSESPLRGLVLIDLPDHDSAAVQHREQVDRILGLVDAVIWVVDPEKYADAVIHERYLRPMAGHAEITFVVLNQVDRLPGEAAEQVLDDLRRLLDEDGIALGEYGEPGATVLALSALTGDGIGELRESLGQFVAERQGPARRIAADVDAAARRLRPVYVTGRRTGLSEEAREEFADRLADAVGATAAGEAAERAWLRNANRACGTPWLRLWRWYHDRREPATGRLSLRAQADEEATARQRVEQAVRTVSDHASAGLPAPWALAMREAAVRGAHGLPEALDELAARTGLPPGRPPRPGWWPVAVLAQASMTLLQVLGGLWLLGQIVGFMSPNLGVPVLMMLAGIVGGPLIEWSCRMAARGPARRYGHEAERLLREAAAGCGRARVLDPLAAELLRYREVREQYGRVTGVGAGTTTR